MVGAALSLFPTSCGVSGFLNESPEVSVFIKRFSKCLDSAFSQKLMYVCRTQRWLKNSSSDFFFFLNEIQNYRVTLETQGES